MKKFDLSAIMRKAWKLYRKGVAAFSECLHRAWNSAKAEPSTTMTASGSRSSQKSTTTA